MINYEKIKVEHKKISEELTSEGVFNDKENYSVIAKRFSFLEKIIKMIAQREKMLEEIKHLELILSDASEDDDMRNLAQEELPGLLEQAKTVEEGIEEMFFEKEAASNRDVIIEIRSAAGGGEAAMFAADLFKMYTKYIESKGWKHEVLSAHFTEIGGVKEIDFSIQGENCYSFLKFESGVHRVQRVPITESGGRIHTSTATVAVLVEPKNVDLKIDPQDLRIDTYRASGAGGQHVNKTDSAVRITHAPTGLVVACQAGRSQIKNKETAMRVLKARLLDTMQKAEQGKMSSARKTQVGTGDRSEKIRTYNFSEGRVTEHRTKLTLYRLEAILEGDLEEIIKNLKREERRKFYESKGLD